MILSCLLLYLLSLFSLSLPHVWRFLKYIILLISNKINYSKITYSILFQSFDIYRDLFYGPAWDIPCWMFYLHLKIKRIFYFSDVMSLKVNYYKLVDSVVQILFIFTNCFLISCSISNTEREMSSQQLWLQICLFFPLVL